MVIFEYLHSLNVLTEGHKDSLNESLIVKKLMVFRFECILIFRYFPSSFLGTFFVLLCILFYFF